MTDRNQRIHPTPFSDWFASQDTSGRGVWICDRTSDEKIKVEPPTEWGAHWSWNVTEDGKGVCFVRTGLAGAPTKDEADEN